ncbi:MULTISPECIES: hypothetical protein [Pontibacillus]|uniref:Uncharacterized protein n=1 Tax=Pontibacillus chungwhensis TaxID=265426 RepID=A0ABY8V3N2_9BACI|nr:MULTISPECIES: hypothetical protein [Pontibacillus]WIF99220.1 hypothetical protein QNI29_06050 [Pontibacillus chungwhensis]
MKTLKKIGIIGALTVGLVAGNSFVTTDANAYDACESWYYTDCYQ